MLLTSDFTASRQLPRKDAGTNRTKFLSSRITWGCSYCQKLLPHLSWMAKREAVSKYICVKRQHTANVHEPCSISACAPPCTVVFPGVGRLVCANNLLPAHHFLLFQWNWTNSAWSAVDVFVWSSPQKPLLPGNISDKTKNSFAGNISGYIPYGFHQALVLCSLAECYTAWFVLQLRAENLPHCCL